MSGSTFGAVQQASNALNAARYALEVTSQNISNANTPGYTRQSAQLNEVDQSVLVPSIYTRAAQTAGGVTVSGTVRLNDAVLDARARTEHARGGFADTTASQVSAIEQVFPEPTDTGLSEQLNDFWNAWGPVADNPSDSAARTVLLQKAATVTSTLNTMSGALDTIRDSVKMSLSQSTDKVTSYGSQLADLNKQIAVGTATHANVNSLLDQRDVILDSLSSLVGATAVINSNGTADVSIDGQPLVSGQTASVFASDPDTGTATVGGTAVTVSTGQIGANLTALNQTIGHYQDQLDSVAAALASTVNTAQQAGYALDGSSGVDMFTGSTAKTITVAFTDPTLVAASATGTAGGDLDGTNALTISGYGQNDGGPDDLYTHLVGDVAASSALAQQQQSTQAVVSQSVDTLRTAASGVSDDEEVSNMLTYQRAYQASSRVLTTLDDMLDTLINHTGVVGRG